MIISICVGSSCHLKGARRVVEQLQPLIAQTDANIELGGCFCLNNCTEGVCVKLDGELFSLQPEDVQQFFETEILRRLSPT
ncbi:MAG: (2Fe-2S) ferredoxin domain-containing protein [Clostridiales bacterium]|nr:(2Fe-2S) ferredoxin domain-containing protein [Clostridiales bacterium]